MIHSLTRLAESVLSMPRLSSLGSQSTRTTLSDVVWKCLWLTKLSLFFVMISKLVRREKIHDRMYNLAPLTAFPNNHSCSCLTFARDGEYHATLAKDFQSNQGIDK